MPGLVAVRIINAMTSAVATDPPRSTHPATRAQVSWLTAQLTAWQAEGLLDDVQAARISGRYHTDHRSPLARLLLTIGAAFVGVGLIWLVAAKDRKSTRLNSSHANISY